MHSITNNSPFNKSILNEEQNVIKLIRLFRDHECLWNPSCQEYRDLVLKESVWNAIAAKFDGLVNADQVKRKIKGLRNCFSTERSRVQKSITDGQHGYVPTLYYYKEFEFLYAITKSSKSSHVAGVKVEVGDDFEEYSSREDYVYNPYVDNQNHSRTNDWSGSSSNQNENSPDDMKIFEPIILSKQIDEQIPPRKRLRRRSSHNSERLPPPAINGTQVQSLCEMIRVDLQDVNERLFFEAKWKIMDILREVHRKHLDSKSSSTGQPDLADTSSAAVSNTNNCEN